MVQGELFNEDSAVLPEQNSSSFFARNQIVLTFDKVILLTIALMVLFILSYSFGFERGNHAAEKKIQALTAHIETIANSAAAPELAIEQAVPKDTQVLQVSSSAQAVSSRAAVTQDAARSADNNSSHGSDRSNADVPQGKYTIQVATVASKERAEKENIIYQM